MPNKYYLREDRKAVKPEKEKPELWHVYKDGRIGVLLPDEMASCMIFEDHLASLPALDVDPDYLKRLSTGWFEGEERYEHTNGIGRWLECSKEDYDTSYPNLRRLTIVAPQEAEKLNDDPVRDDFWIMNEPGQRPATPQPVTGEERSRMIELLDWYNGRSCNKLIIQKHVDDFIDLFPNPIAASRPSDAVASQWVSMEDRLPECGLYNISYYNPSDKYKKLYVIPLCRGRDGWYYDRSEKEPAEDSTLKVTHWLPLPTPPTK